MNLETRTNDLKEDLLNQFLDREGLDYIFFVDLVEGGVYTIDKTVQILPNLTGVDLSKYQFSHGYLTKRAAVEHMTTPVEPHYQHYINVAQQRKK